MINTIITEDGGTIAYNGSGAYMPGIAIVTFSQNDIFEAPDALPFIVPGHDESGKCTPWGEKNDTPNQVVAITEKNAVASSLLEFLVDLGFGSGIKMGTHDEKGDFKPYTSAEIQRNAELRDIDQWMRDNDINSLLAEILTDLRWFAAAHIELGLDNNSPAKVATVTHRETMFSRWSEPGAKGEVKYHFYSSIWHKVMKPEDVIVTPALDLENPMLDLKRRIGLARWPDKRVRKTKENRLILPMRMPGPGRKLYPRPYWYSIIQSGWLEFANHIPEFKKKFMTNFLSAAFHVEINETYFPRVFAQEGIKTTEEQEARVKKEFSDIRKFLQGSENAGSTVITYFKQTADGKQIIPDIKITPIEKKIGGEFVEDSHEASAMIYTAFRVHPNLVGIIPGKQASNLSGSDKRELLRIAQTMQGRLRDRALRFLYIVKEVNGWPRDLEFSITDIILTTLDQGRETQKINVV